MTFLFNDPTDFMREMVDGLLAAYPDRLAAVPGGVVRSTATPPGQVAVVTGGGSGHYPAFAGLVGPGLAHGAALGNIFASPSAQQAYSVACAAQAGGGVLLTYGNYTGDCLNFDEAQERLRADGIDCLTVTVTDDISSAPPDEWARRRGIAGDLCVFKAAAWAAEQGMPLREVAEFTRFANSRTRSFGIAFSGCTLPGGGAPLFEVPPGRMGVGMGIHGEPGLREQPVGSADDIARLLVDGLLAEVPDGAGQRVAVLTNGLGAVAHEELFVLHSRVDTLLRAAGLAVVQPDVGELCTSLDMAGVSVTLCWLSDELEQAWLAPADTPAYRKGSVAAGVTPRPAVAPAPAGETPSTAAETPQTPAEACDASRQWAEQVAEALQVAATYIDSEAGALGALDAIAGDGDHGIGMQRGTTAAAEAARQAVGRGAGCSATFLSAGDAWANAAGGTSGALWGVLLKTIGGSFDDAEPPTAAGLVAAVDRASDAVQRAGKTAPGDKTMVDALAPFAGELARQYAAGAPLTTAWQQAATVAQTAAADTARLLPRAGRARPHAEQAVGTPDPGAISLAGIAGAIAEWLGSNEPQKVRRR